MIEWRRGMGNFSSFYAELYDQTNPQLIPEEFTRLLFYAKQAKGVILEGMCGTGRVLIPLREQKIPVEGLDICPFMLHTCQSKLRGKSLTPKLHLQNIEQLSLPQTYELIFILAKSLSMLKKEQLPHVFQKIHAQLNPGGSFIFDLWDLIHPSVQHEAKIKQEFRTKDGSL